MPGELWRSYWQAGKEVTAGTGVAATRRMYFRTDSALTRERESRPHRFMTASRDNQRAHTLGPVQVGGEVSMPVSSSEILELLLIGLKGGVTPTTPVGATAARLWTFTPGTTLDSATLEWHDGAREWEANGVNADSLNLAGSVGGDNILTAELFGMSLVSTTMTPALAERTPAFLEGWQTNLYVDNFGGTPGTTVKNGLMVNWDVTISNGLGRKYTASNTLSPSAITTGELEVEATLTFEASSADANTEYSNWDAETKRLVRLEFLGPTNGIETGFRNFVTIDIPGAWSAVDLSGTDEGTRVYELSLAYLYDSTNAYGVQVRCQNNRAAAW